eukprot:7210104-Prorocentrum_lima.AAC.1
MTSSLVGSEMCIRDRTWREQMPIPPGASNLENLLRVELVDCIPRHIAETVSYTHLTLPTICSV